MTRVSGMVRAFVAVFGICGCLAATRRTDRTSVQSDIATHERMSECSGWAAPQPILTSDGRPVYVESPSSVRLTPGYALFGFPTVVWTSPNDVWRTDSVAPTQVAMGAMFGSDGSVQPIAPPPSLTERPADVIGVSDGRGGAHVFWSTVPRSSSGPSIIATHVFGARYSNKGWSTPDVILNSNVIRWNRVSAAAVTARGETHLVISASRPTGETGGGGIAHVHGSAGQWTTSWISTGSLPPSYVALSASDGQPWVIAFIGAVRTQQMLVDNGAFVVVSRDSGRTWGEIRIVRKFAADVGQRVQLLVTPDGILHLLWIARSDNARDGGRIEHFVSHDASSWRRLEDFTLAAAAGGFQSSVTRAGTIMLTYRQRDNLRIQSTEWAGGAWRPKSSLGDTQAMTDPSVITLDRDSTFVVWGRLRSTSSTTGQSVDRAPVSWWARQISECPVDKPTR